MDKYEFNIKVEQLKKLVNKGDYETAMKIADTIDWRRVRSTSLLTMVAQVYEKNEEYQDAKDILLLAFERAPIGKGLLFKLTDLALREGNISEAEAYYREFCDLSADDPRQNLLRYLILEAKGAPAEQLLNTLERYCQDELDEKWLYKLAELYQEAGREQDCVMICDKIMLMFGLGKYVDKAMELKLQYAPLTKYQMDLVENREKYEEKLRAVEQQYNSKTRRPPQEDDFDEEDEAYDESNESSLEDNLVVKMHEAEAEEDLAKEMSKIQPFDEEEPSSPMEETRILGDIRHINQFRTGGASTREEFAGNEAAATRESVSTNPSVEMINRTADRIAARFEEEETVVEDWDLEPEEVQTNHLMIEADDAASGLNLALESLKKLHRELGSKNAVAKISGDNLNKKGVFAVADRLVGKDLIVERAADLNAQTVMELSELMERDDTGMIVVLIDTPVRMEHLHNNNASLAGKFQYIGCDRSAENGSIDRSEASEKERQAERLRLQAEQEAEAARQRKADAEAEALRKLQMEREAEEARARAEYEAEEMLRLSRENGGDMRRQSEYDPEDEWDQNERSGAYPADSHGDLEADSGVRQEYGNAGYQDRYEAAQYRDEYEGEPAQGDYENASHGAEYDEDYQAEYEAGDNQAEYEDDRHHAEYEERQHQAEYEDDGALADYAAGESEGLGFEESGDDHEMDVEEFAQYACKYAAEIDCSISGKSMLALYERAEMMEEDGVPLTKANAEDLLEEAADKAEKRSFGGLFSSKYDKDGLLILKEKHFFD